jgi:superfamily I DNA/RNA helicase
MGNSIISKNKSRPAPPRTLKAIPENGDGAVEVLHFSEHAKEIDHLAKCIQKFLADGVPPGQIIVLCQSREYIRPLYEALQGAGVPSEFCYLESQFDEDQAKERMALLSLAGDQDDRVALRYLVGNGSNDWRTAQWSKIRAASVAEGKSPWDLLVEMAAGTRSTAGVKALVDSFRDIQTQLAGLTTLTGVDLVNAWLPAGVPCTELRALADSVAADHPACDAKQLAQKVREIVTEPDIPDMVPDVRIMSLHKSKGLSANVVIIAGCVEGALPRQRGIVKSR